MWPLLLDDHGQRRLLEEALDRARAVGDRGVLVFDLDSTVFDNRPRQARIFAELGDARALVALQQIRPEHFTSWSLVAAMRRAGLDEPTLRELADEARAFWRERFFTSRYCHLDRAIAGARAFLEAVAGSGAVVAYVTGRHIGMREGTVAAMAREGFPVPDGAKVQLLLKPGFEEDDDAWKLRAHALVAALGEVVAVFDNEPAHLNGYAARFPKALAVHLATDHSERPIPLAPGLPSIRDFRR